MTDQPVVMLRTKNGKKTVEPGIDPEARTWTARNGTTFKLRKVSIGALQRIQSNPDGKPTVPQIFVKYAANASGFEANPDDPSYKEAYADWKARNSYKTMLYCFGAGIDLEIPAEFTEMEHAFFPEANEYELRYHYVTFLIGMEQVDELVTAIMSQNTPTEGGIAEAVDSFPGNRER